MHHVFSTLANDQLYTNWLPGGGDVHVKGPQVLIRGGTGVANDRLITPLGVVTEVDNEQLAELQKNPVFLQHEKAGHIVVRQKKADPEKVAADMNLKDKSAPLTPADYVGDENAAQPVLK